MDVKTAYLNGDLEEEIFMRQPEGFIDKDQPNLVCKLKKSLYGLKQSARCWNKTIDEYLKKSGYVQSDADPCIYVKKVMIDGEERIILIALYVDDLLIASNDINLLEMEKRNLSKRFEMVDEGEVHFILGMQVKRNRKEGLLSISQQAFLSSTLKRFGMEDCKPVATPLEPGTKFEKLLDEKDVVELKGYQSVIGCLTYASIGTRPDIAASVGVLSQYMSKPGKQHWVGVKRVLRYLKGTLDYGLLYTATNTGGTTLRGYADADWAGDQTTRKSTSGYAFQIGNSTISWRSKRQSIVALSSTEAEYVSLSLATQEATWIRTLLGDMGFMQDGPTTMYEDNQGAIELARNPSHHTRTKHIDIKYHHVRCAVADKQIKLQYCPSTEMTADILTKGLPRASFEKLRKKLGIIRLEN